MNVKQLQPVEARKRLVIIFNSGEEMIRGLNRPGQGPESGQADRSQRDQLDDRGRQRHIGHGEQAGDQGDRRPLEETDQNEDLGRHGEDSQWEDKTEGTSRL